ncbi:MAG: hypothetical protein RRC07_14670, partial [Anaerolineae bacterium]|nr:hypothetical protein [Anaerolineae bacterium]
MNCPERERLSDYALSFLPAAERDDVAAHLVACPTCRGRVQDERKLAQRVRHTIAATAVPPRARLQALMPAPPRRRRAVPLALLRPVAVLGLLLMLFAGSLQLQLPVTGQSLPTASATALAATATQIPDTGLTATAVHEMSALRLAPVPIAA